MSFGERFGSLVLRYRTEQGLSLRDLARRVYTIDGSGRDVDVEARAPDVNKIELGLSKMPRAATVEKFRLALDIPHSKITEIRSPKQSQYSKRLERLIGKISESERGALSNLQVTALAERVSENAVDFGSATNELRNSVALANVLETEARARSNYETQFEQVLSLVVSSNLHAELDLGAQILEEALSDVATIQHKIFDALVKQHTLRQDSEAVAIYVMQRLKTLHPQSDELDEALLADCHERLRKAKIQGTTFDCDVAYSIAKERSKLASSDFTVGYLTVQGIAKTTVGLRVDDDSLQEAELAWRTAALANEVSLEVTATVQNGLGITLVKKGERQESLETLAEAISCLKKALRIRDGFPTVDAWAMTKNNIGATLSAMGEIEKNPVRLIDAARCYKTAIQRLPRKPHSLQWGMTVNNLGYALTLLGRMTSRPCVLDMALTYYELALEERQREVSRIDWAQTRFNQGITYTTLARLQERNRPSLIDEARLALEHSLVVWRATGSDYYVALTESALSDCNSI